MERLSGQPAPREPPEPVGSVTDAEDWARWDAEEREAVRGLANPPHFELNDGTCVACGNPWPCPNACDEYKEITVRLGDLETLLYGYETPDATALGSRPIERIREAITQARQDEINRLTSEGSVEFWYGPPVPRKQRDDPTEKANP